MANNNWEYNELDDESSSPIFVHNHTSPISSDVTPIPEDTTGSSVIVSNSSSKNHVDDSSTQSCNDWLKTTLFGQSVNHTLSDNIKLPSSGMHIVMAEFKKPSAYKNISSSETMSRHVKEISDITISPRDNKIMEILPECTHPQMSKSELANSGSGEWKNFDNSYVPPNMDALGKYDWHPPTITSDNWGEFQSSENISGELCQSSSLATGPIFNSEESSKCDMSKYSDWQPYVEESWENEDSDKTYPDMPEHCPSLHKDGVSPEDKKILTSEELEKYANMPLPPLPNSNELPIPNENNLWKYDEFGFHNFPHLWTASVEPKSASSTSTITTLISETPTTEPLNMQTTPVNLFTQTLPTHSQYLSQTMAQETASNEFMSKKIENKITIPCPWMNPLQQSQTVSLRMSRSLEGIDYLSIPRVFRYISLGGYLNKSDLLLLGKIIRDSVYPSPSKSPMITIINPYYSIDSIDPQNLNKEISIVKYVWSDYPTMARECLKWIVDKPHTIKYHQ